MWRVFTLGFLVCGCGGLYSKNPDGGVGGGNGGLGPPDCMRTFADAISVPVPAAPNAFLNIQGMRFGPDHNLYVLSRSNTDESFVAVLGTDLKFIRAFGRGQLGPTQDMIVAANGITYVLEDFDSLSKPPDVVRFDANGAKLK